jgi:hypothetical protein
MKKKSCVLYHEYMITRMSDQQERERNWTLLTGHGHVLVEIARNPEARIRDIATAVDLTERTVQAIVADLETAGYLTRTRTGRRTRYSVNPDSLFRHPAQEGHRIGPFLDLLATYGDREPGDDRRGLVRDREDHIRSLDDGGDVASHGQPELPHRLHGDRGDQPDAAGVEFDVGDGLAVVDGGDPGRNLVSCAQPHDGYSFRRAVASRQPLAIVSNSPSMKQRTQVPHSTVPSR